MTELPPPLTTMDCDLRDFPYMPLDVVRLRDAGIASIDAEAFRAAVISWCVAWHQTPAASLPDDDILLCRMLGYGRDLKGWRKLREAGALRGYILCADGRLYHPVVAEKATEAMERKRIQRDRTEAARRSRLSQRQNPSVTDQNSSVTENVTETRVTNVTASKGREGKGEEGKKETSLRDGKKSHSRPRTVCPADWTPDAAGAAYAKARGLLQTEITKFRNYHIGKGNLMADWNAAWRTWCDNAVDYGKAPGLPLELVTEADAVERTTANQLGVRTTPIPIY